ncbi:SLC13 family permease [Agromyces sp. NPDC058110]|uniref:SLC13 family permease n=1 Tax=Agromyces sp. NPDC058110 TaxID=3346345 RepID=UPI0036DA1CE8
MDPVVVTLVILALAIAAFLSNRVPLGIVAIGVSVALWLTGVLDLQQALAGFGDPSVVFVATLFVVSEALDSTGVTAWAGQFVIGRAGTKRTRLLVVIGALAAVFSAFVSVNGAVAALIPVVVVVAARAGLPPSQLLMPLAFSASAGSMLALTGTPVNIIVSQQAADAGSRPFGFFEFALVGLPLVLGTVVIVVALGRWLLPSRSATALPRDLTAYASTLRRQYALPDDTELIGTRAGVAEVVVAPRSELIGLRLFPGMTTPSGDLVVIAVQRSGEALTGDDAVLQAGDTLLLSGEWEALERNTSGPDVLVVDRIAGLRRSVPLGVGAKRSIAVLAVMVVLLATGIVPPAIAGLIAASALVLLRVLTPVQSYRSISWTTVVLIAGMIPLSTAFVETGAADLAAQGLLDLVGGASPTIALLAVCVLTMVLGQLISNTATVLIVAPIAVVIADALGVSVLPFMMALSVAGAAAFLTPVATPANTMVLDPGAYRFGDYWKLGLPLLVWFLVVAVLYVPLIWPF